MARQTTVAALNSVLTQISAPPWPCHCNGGMDSFRIDPLSPMPDEASRATELDLRALPMPEPLERALAAADALPPGGTLGVLTPFMPLPLLEVLAERGLQADAEPLPEQGARVWIRRPDAHGPADD
jgi:hypothetical protein